MAEDEILKRISSALEAACVVLRQFTPGRTPIYKRGVDPVTAADETVDKVLREYLARDGEGWLSEHTLDNPGRLKQRRVWIVDPLDGTREFVQGIPEWCVSIALVEDGMARAGGACNPATGEVFLGARGVGVRYNGAHACSSRRKELKGATVLASRTEVERGEWNRFEGAPFLIRPLGSIAYKLALVAVGRADATWTLVPKHEWDVAAGIALVQAGGGHVYACDDAQVTLNRRRPLIGRLIACGPHLHDPIVSFLKVPITARPVVGGQLCVTD